MTMRRILSNSLREGRWFHCRRHNYCSSRILPMITTSSSNNRRISSDAENYSNNSDTQICGDMKIFNTMTEGLESLPQTKKGLLFYTCGPTVYAPAHLGHARTYVCLDILRRVMIANSNSSSTSSRRKGRRKRQDVSTETDSTAPNNDDNTRVPAPLFVLNITDVDDKILAAAAAASTGNDGRDSDSNGGDPVQLARKYEREFWRDWDALNCLRPNIVTRVTEHAESHIVPFIERLVEKGMAYEYVDGVYFDVSAYNKKMNHLTKYGKLAPPAAAHGTDDILRKANINNNNNDDDDDDADDIKNYNPANQKRDVRDFVLWKKRKGQEALYFASPWGDGRPGWHIECSAMIEAIQEKFRDSHEFFAHAGGIDLKFPHHTNEIAQSEAYLGVGEWIPHWVHTGHLYIDGLKMSKSLKNFISIEDFLNGSYNTRGNDNDDNEENGADDLITVSNHTTKVTTTESKSISSHSSRNVFESPADDFRLWCLALSGSYRGSATFSTSRIIEGRNVRLKVLRFLVDSEIWIHSNDKDKEIQQLSTKVLHDAEIDLYKVVDRAKRRGLAALENDLDGSTFLSELLFIVNYGTKYIKAKNIGPVEPMISCIADVRHLLRLVGFTTVTTEAGKQSDNFELCSNSNKTRIDDLAKKLVQFRSKVRRIALEDRDTKENNEMSDGMKKILALSDELRDFDLPKVGIELIDSNNIDKEDDWRLCLPNKKTKIDQKSSEGIGDDSSESNSESILDLMSIPLTDYFRAGQYEGCFAQYLEDGLPTHNADGSEVSKRLLKKLKKKQKKHRHRLDT